MSLNTHARSTLGFMFALIVREHLSLFLVVRSRQSQCFSVHNLRLFLFLSHSRTEKDKELCFYHPLDFFGVG